MSDTPITNALRADISKGYNAVLESHEKLERENAKLRELLKKIGTVNAHLPGAAFRMQEIARESLGERVNK